VSGLRPQVCTPSRTHGNKQFSWKNEGKGCMFVHARPLSCNDGFQEYYYSSDLYYSLKQLKVLSAKKAAQCNKVLSTNKTVQ
jgi:hypothetical protein